MRTLAVPIGQGEGRASRQDDPGCGRALRVGELATIAFGVYSGTPVILVWHIRGTPEPSSDRLHGENAT
jgi:hypothetical protein